MRKVGIIGVGVIGSAIWKLFPRAYLYDPPTYDSEKTLSADFVFICVPTPLDNGVLDCRIVEESVKKTPPDSIVIVCSTLQPGTADRLASLHKRKIVVQPEYFGETVKHPLSDLSKQPFLILGGESKDVDEVIDLYKTVYNANIRIRKVSRLEAEVIKLSENRAAAFKIAQCQELYDACVASGIDYNIIREAVYGDDPRFNLWWTFIYKKRGFDSKCIPKDVYAWCSWAKSNTDVTDALLARNEELIGGTYKQLEP